MTIKSKKSKVTIKSKKSKVMIKSKKSKVMIKSKKSKVMIKSKKNKVPREFKEFLRNGENKTTLIKMMFMLIIANKDRVLLLLKNVNKIYRN